MGKLSTFKSNLVKIREESARAMQMIGGITVADKEFDRQIEKIAKCLQMCNQLATKDNIQLWESKGARTLDDWCKQDSNFKKHYEDTQKAKKHMRLLCDETVSNSKKFQLYMSKTETAIDKATKEGADLLKYYLKNNKREKADELKTALASLVVTANQVAGMPEQMKELRSIVEKCARYV